MTETKSPRFGFVPVSCKRGLSYSFKNIIKKSSISFKKSDIYLWIVEGLKQSHARANILNRRQKVFFLCETSRSSNRQNLFSAFIET